MRYALAAFFALFFIATDDSFDSQVKPVLARTCTPCHVKGGQMYDKLPFDKADVVRANREGIVRRLKGDDKKALEKWFEETEPLPSR